MNEEVVPTPSEDVPEISQDTSDSVPNTGTSSETVETYTEVTEPVPVVNYDEVIWGELIWIRYTLVFIALLMLASRFIRVGR